MDLSGQFNTISAATPHTDMKRPAHSMMGDNGIVLNLDKPGDKNSFRARKFSRNGSVSQRGDSEVRMDDDDEAVKIEALKKSIESEDEGPGDSRERMVVQNHSLERGFKQARFSHQNHMRDSIESGGVHLMKVNVELDVGKPTQINRLPQPRKATEPKENDGIE